MKKPYFVLSPCGTSVLTNCARDGERAAITHHANAQNEQDISPEDRAVLQDLIRRTQSKLQEADVRDLPPMSAELNALFKLYHGQFDKATNDQHWLLCTDTWLGRQTGELIKEALEGRGLSSVQRYQPKDMQTKELLTFQSALSDLVKWCEETIEPCREHNHVVFNLTGGFKSIQGFLQTLAAFYADEAIYVFESGEELLRLPRLPIRLDADDVVRRRLHVFRRLAIGLGRDEQCRFDTIPETLLLCFDDKVGLSPWGDLVWERTHKGIYREKLWPSPSEKIIYGERFAASVKSLSPDRMEHVNTRIDDLAVCLELEIHRDRLDLKPLKGKGNNYTHELDAWADQDAKRMYGRLERGVLTLEVLDRALH